MANTRYLNSIVEDQCGGLIIQINPHRKRVAILPSFPQTIQKNTRIVIPVTAFPIREE